MFFGITNLWAYVVGTFLIILLPGPNSLFVLSTAAQRGVRRGYQAACGVFLGDSVLMFLSAAGVASLLKSTPILFSVVKYSGAAYLAWIGFGMLRSAWKSWRTPATAAAEPGTPAPPPRQANPFRKALSISLLNPKAILFFVAFFVQFVDPSYGAPALSFVILALIAQAFSFCYLSTLIFGGTYLAGQFRRRRRLSATLTSGVGALFLGFGAKLATATLN
ncbi:leucine efflux protein [Planotetraspora thailandica]|uniref:Leucine efflux protein n=1 Tax=Planotetraspora thailandica TaxID=487172 RepID=A0A8J4DEQ0_9ACTN|nr:leucine efflux protein LeuE [Planotetraspora thailandica]GII59384.1 leucine efflux protein [Planotetraspora thailandica]